MDEDKTQRSRYDELYRSEFQIKLDIPDYKITAGKECVNKKICVLGAGAAKDTRFLIENNEVWGLDYSESAVRLLNKLGIKGFKADLNELLDLKNNYFDIVVAKDILEHLNDPSILINEIHRILKPKGYVVINVPNHFYLPMRLRILFGKNLIWKAGGHDHAKDFEEWNYLHKIYFTWSGFRKFIEKHNFEIERNFWDFGTLNHYSQPEMAFLYLEQKYKQIDKLPLKMIKIIWGVANFVFPKNVRAVIVSLSPSLLCASFYVWCKPTKKK